MLRFTWFLGAVASLALGCGSGGEGGADAGDPKAVVGLEIAPSDAALVVTDGQIAEQSYTATAHLADGSTEIVTDETGFSIEDVQLGSFDGATFATSGVAGGRSLVRGVYEGAAGEALLTVRIEGTRVEDPAPADAPDLFDGAAEDPARAPVIVYPEDQTMVPPNLGDFEAHWTDPLDSDLYEVKLSGEYVDLRVYVTGNPGDGSFATFEPDEWSVAGESQRGGELEVIVRGLNTADPSSAGTAQPITVELTDQDVEGGIYYWASTGASPSGIYRHDMDRPGEPAEPFYTTDESDGNRCVACHVLSRDGSRMAITFEGGDGPASVLDVATRAPIMPTDGTYRWNFATFGPDAERLLTVHQGEMILRDAETGQAIGDPVATGGHASHPDFSPNGDAVVYVKADSPITDWRFTGGSLVVQPFDPADDTFGDPTELVSRDTDTTENFYYPSWSPDGEWILFNRSTQTVAEDGNAYDDPSAALWAVPADGSIDPIELDTPNLGDELTNSWGRWTPFEQTLKISVSEEEPFFWLTFSSKRAFGVRLDQGQPQIWMAPFFPERALAGEDPSAPAFRLPFQNLGTNNHIAQWTEEVVPID